MFGMRIEAFLAQVTAGARYRGQIAAVRKLPARPARFAWPREPVAEPIRRALWAAGIEQLYTHQAAAVDLTAEGKDLVVVSGTASGKTLCYNLPVLQALLAQPEARALYLFPTKALTQDQLGTLKSFAQSDAHIADVLRPGVYDGDTPTQHRKRIRQEASIILSNPDMLHVSILPHHGRWMNFFSQLRYVVLDEVHSYRGIFGSHVALVLRRLQRICRHYGADPQFLCSSATIANPIELVSRLIGREPIALIDEDGSPRGAKYFVLWNPPMLDADTLRRRSVNIEAQELMLQLIEQGARTITFAKARVVAELLFRYLRDELQRRRPELAERVRSYRGGYLAEERRHIERELFSGRLLGVCTTNALELGIDVGALDAAIIVGFPGTICSTWQQAGRAGRKADESICFLLAYDDPIDQYLMRHPHYFFDQTPERAVIDPENPFILQSQLCCAANELALRPEELERFGGQAEEVLASLESAPTTSGDEENVWRVHRTKMGWHWAVDKMPAPQVNLRMISDATISIEDLSGSQPRSIGNVDRISAPELVYPGAIYLHEGESYLVRELSMEAKRAVVERIDVDYYTQPVLRDACRVLKTLDREGFRGGLKHYGDVRVTWQTVAFRRFKYYTLENLGQISLELDAQTIDTRAVWLVAPEDVLQTIAAAGFKPLEALVGVRNMMLVTLPVLAMCDRRDISGLIDSSHTGVPAMFVYDRYPGGLGFAQRGYDLLDEWLGLCLQMVRDCPCADGCPSCVGLANLRPPLHQDPDLYAGYAIPSKAAAQRFLAGWLRDGGA
jgi:DEAD/DEAH box helicase domain-containing protein